MTEFSHVENYGVGKLPVLRVARPTDRLEQVTRFYRDGLGFTELAKFVDHDGFDGVVLGAPHAPYHLEFTHQRGHVASDAPSDEHLLVFYVPDREDFMTMIRRIEAIGASRVVSCNPYWDRVGVTFADPDGYRIVVQNAGWTR